MAEIERSLAIGAGLAPPDTNWALGHAWRELYPAIVESLGGRALGDEAWPAFARLAARMERLAFGPSPENAAKLLALIDSGRVDLRHVHGGPIRSPVDAEIDTVLPGPQSRAPVLDQLVQDGHVHVASGRRGITTDVDGSCAPGLAVIGRPTEDWVIGNDTLNRALHPQVDRWARRVAASGRVSQVVA